MKSLCTPDSYEVLCRSISLKLQSDSSGCEYRMLPFHTCVRKWKSKATVRSDADSPGHCRLLWGSNNVECGHCSAGNVELSGRQIVVGLLLSLKTKEFWSFPVASICGSCPLGCYRTQRPYNLPLPMLVHWVNPTFSRSVNYGEGGGGEYSNVLTSIRHF